MLDDALKSQLQTYLGMLRAPIRLIASRVICTCPSCAGSKDPPSRPMTMPFVAIGKPARILPP